MSDMKLRLKIARCAAQLMYAREEKEYFTAKRKAARRFGVNERYAPSDLPSNREIRDEIQKLAEFYEGERRFRRLTDMRIEALRMMRRLAAFQPHLIGSVCTGHIREGSDIDLHVFTDSPAALSEFLISEGIRHSVENKRIIKHGEERHFTHIHLEERFPIELTVYSADKVNYPFKSSITGKTIERASIDQLERLIRESDPAVNLDERLERAEDYTDVYEIYRGLLLPLEEVKQDARWHPEGDALFHSLQVFELALRERGYDEEFLLAALLHDVGKAIDPMDHVGAGLAALEGIVTERTAWLIEHHMTAHEIRAGEIRGKALEEFRRHEDFEDLLLLSELDQKGRVPGADVCTVEEAIDTIRAMAEEA